MFSTLWKKIFFIFSFEPYMIKGTVSRDFLRLAFLWISFPPTPECPVRTVSNFFENSRRYSQLKVDHRCRWHRWQIKKIFNQKNFNNFVGTPLDTRLKGIVQPLKRGVMGGINRYAFKFSTFPHFLKLFLKDPGPLNSKKRIRAA